MKVEQIVMLTVAGAIAVAATVMLVNGTAGKAKNYLAVDTSQDATIELDGQPLGSAGKDAHALFELKKGHHAVHAKLADGRVEDAALDVPVKGYYRALLRVGTPKSVALVSVAYGNCNTYYNNGHVVRYEGKAITTPGIVPLPTEKGLVELSGELYLESFDAAFSETFPLSRKECGWLSTHLCHLTTDGEPTR
jgi:hypothetical protein